MPLNVSSVLLGSLLTILGRLLAQTAPLENIRVILDSHPALIARKGSSVVIRGLSYASSAPWANLHPHKGGQAAHYACLASINVQLAWMPVSSVMLDLLNLLEGSIPVTCVVQNTFSVKLDSLHVLIALMG